MSSPLENMSSEYRRWPGDKVPSLGQTARAKFQALDKQPRQTSKPWISSDRRGFTLIEVLLAMAILGICMTGLLVAVSQSLAVAQRARRYETARNLIARVELEQPLLLEEEIEEGLAEGDFDGDFPGYRWQRTIELDQSGSITTGIFEEQEDLFRITTRVLWERRGRKQFEEVVTLLYRPDQGGGQF